MENFFFCHTRESNWGLSHTLFVTREISPIFGEKKSGKSFPLYSFASDPSPHLGKIFPKLFFSVVYSLSIAFYPYRLSL